MNKIKAGVITFPGSNCDIDLIRTLKVELEIETINLWHKENNLQDCTHVFLPGGFSYGDYLRTGAIAKFSPIMKSVIQHAENGGFVMGICNGFQILTEAGLLPGVLMHNTSMNFICDYISITPPLNAKYQNITNTTYTVPIAHAEGNYYANEAQINKMLQNGQILFQYTNKDGKIVPEVNPNGSVLNIAGICNERGNIIGMMPHPERVSNELLGNDDGKLLLKRLLFLV